MDINTLDIAILVVLILFGVRGLLRGFGKEILGIIGLVGGLWAAYTYYPSLAAHLTFFKTEVWRNVLAYALLFIGVNLFTSLLAHILHQILALAFLLWLDKLLGAALGIVKGLLLCAILITVGQYLFAEHTLFASSAVLPYFNMLLEFAQSHIPKDLFTL